MSVQSIQLNSNAVSMDGSAADKLLRLGSGDAALVYLYLLRRQGLYDPAEAVAAFRWQRYRLDSALAQLQELGLVGNVPLPETIEQNPLPEDAPSYTAADIANELTDSSSQFPPLLQEVERIMGRRMSTTQTSILLELYDHVGLPSEVILTLVNWLDQRNKEKYGSEKRLQMSYVKRVGYQWKERGYDTLEAADEYIRTIAQKETQQGAILGALGIFGRKPTSTEAKYIRQWMEWQFPVESISVAYDLTVTKTGKMSWNYCNAILSNWHKKNLHTLAEVSAESKPQPTVIHSSYNPPAPQKDQEQLERESRENFLEMQRLLEQMKQEEQ